MSAREMLPEIEQISHVIRGFIVKRNTVRRPHCPRTSVVGCNGKMYCTKLVKHLAQVMCGPHYIGARVISVRDAKRCRCWRHELSKTNRSCLA